MRGKRPTKYRPVSINVGVDAKPQCCLTAELSMAIVPTSPDKLGKQTCGIFPPSPSPPSTPERMCVYSFFTHPLRGLLLRDNFFAKVNHSFPRPLAAQHGKYNAGQREVPAYFRYQCATLRIPPATLLEGVLCSVFRREP
ncbi:jg4762 [Pararge aegeria aegeria]|uniref:Jg4762 protein n=1 Tax=Pararge aegeria aegeria TaxID=348720 RepID=A0A8S4R9D9_9NEOP|nr:jg4762 [Pararge aegeria aegeria]